MLRQRNKPLRRDLKPLDRPLPPWKEGKIPAGKVDTSALPHGVVPRARERYSREEIYPGPRPGQLYCEWCGMITDAKRQDEHHLVPVSLGGPDHPYNKMRLCGPRAAWGCHKDAQEGRIPLEALAARHALLFPEIRDGAHLLEEINKRRTRINKGA